MAITTTAAKAIAAELRPTMRELAPLTAADVLYELDLAARGNPTLALTIAYGALAEVINIAMFDAAARRGQ